MEEQFWQTRWQQNRIGFHEGEPNGLLVAHFDSLGLKAGDSVFVPLSGKAVDLDWLAEKGLQVIGAELNEDAVREVYARQGLTPTIEADGPLTVYMAGNVTLYAGDFFALTGDHLAGVVAIYDRAALVAMPDGMRERYAAHLAAITGNAPQLLISLDYDQSQTNGPPFSVPQSAIEALYDGIYRIEQLGSRPIGGLLAERCRGDENAYTLSPA